MPTCTVRIEPAVRRELHHIQPADRDRIIRAINELVDNPRPFGSKKLRGGRSTHRVRVGDYRILYDVNDDALMVEVSRVAHRRNAYR